MCAQGTMGPINTVHYWQDMEQGLAGRVDRSEPVDQRTRHHPVHVHPPRTCLMHRNFILVILSLGLMQLQSLLEYALYIAPRTVEVASGGVESGALFLLSFWSLLLRWLRLELLWMLVWRWQ